MPGALRTAALQLRTARRLVRTGDEGLRRRLGPLDERLVFVFGSPRSGTSFLAGAIGSLPGFADLGEVAPLKAAVPELAGLPSDRAAARVRRLLAVTRRLGLVGSARAVEQTPETAFVAPAVARAFPQACLIHLVRDGRDVVASLLERGWLSVGRGGEDDAWQPYGPEPRFWVEDDRRNEFPAVSDARRAAWAWRRYVTAALAVGGRTAVIRYERLAQEPEEVARELAVHLDVPAERLADALAEAHSTSVGRWARDLGPEQQADVEAEAGVLLRELGYLPPS